MTIDERALAYRDAYDAQLRARGVQREAAERSGPVVRQVLAGHGGLITYRDLGGLEGTELDTFIAAQRGHFAALGEAVEWKYHGHDLPADLPERLTAAGFSAEERETVLVGEAAQLAAEPAPPQGVTLREVTSRADLERIQVMEEAVWGYDHSWLPDALERELNGEGDPSVVVVAEAGDEVVSAAWMRLHTGTEFASLWGGSTLAAWRGRGIYRALVAHRARLAVARGVRYLQVDASDDSRPILARLGLLPVTTTTPYVWKPSADRP
ncbi:GNAT family N-acetyltransferase [Streptomyces sp. SPB162]|uniref:GNAT family N-acetyltransferase n=1 Tax=Streptomyces sp. SPB162 TaxID=2940560 RepID=UPI002404D7D7|nr:GNAT family N-acetyltransferase [Streptomyces sp. SPB162]MDF9816375.1 GNAT superfamily N-acetyltransferase [Streptomyces sp. SPB162]